MILKSIRRLIFPKTCISCANVLREYEHNFCINCLSKLQQTNMELYPDFNEITSIFVDFFPIVSAVSYYKYEADDVMQDFIHAFKYFGRKDVAFYLGQSIAYQLKRLNIFADVDFLVPVPLHEKKLKIRSYNQCQYIAEGFQRFYDIPIDNQILKRIKYQESQTFKSRQERVENVMDSFEADCKNPKYVGKHFLIIDDVFTTGATIKACVNALKEIPDIRISIFTIAKAV